MANHRAAGRAQVRSLRASRDRRHRAETATAVTVRAGMLGVLATATIAVPLATASGGVSPVNTQDKTEQTLSAGSQATAAGSVRAEDSRANRSAAQRAQAPTAEQVKSDLQKFEVTDVKAENPVVQAETASDPAAGQELGKGYIKPVGDASISSGYGWRIHPTLGYRKLHDGVDYSASCGQPVHASAAGKVVHASYMGSAGNAVKVDHGNGVITAYFHLSAYKVRVGQTVEQGQVVGLVGSTGRSTGCHLHFAKLDQSGQYSNPLSLFR